MRNAFLLSIVLLGAVLLGACEDNGAANPENIAAASPDRDIVDYGNGVYYFDATRDTFANKLSAFIMAHSELEFVGMTGDSDSTYGISRGYFVVFRERE